METGTLVGLIIFVTMILGIVGLLLWSERKAKALIQRDLKGHGFEFLSLRREKLNEDDPFDWTIDRKTDDHVDDRLVFVEGALVRKVAFKDQDGEEKETWVRVRTYFLFPKDCRWKPRLETFGPKLHPN